MEAISILLYRNKYHKNIYIRKHNHYIKFAHITSTAIKMENLNILLVEDNEGDVLLTCEALEEKLNIKNITVARNGNQAFQILKQFEKTSVIPDIIVLDINLPHKNGFELLDIVRRSKKLFHIPVIILTTSNNLNDQNKAKIYGANLYLIKPLEADEFESLAEQIKNFWLNFKNQNNPGLN